MQKIVPLVLSVVFTIFAQQQQDTIPLPIPALPDSASILPVPPQDTMPIVQPIPDSASVVPTPTPTPTPTPLPQDTTPVVPQPAPALAPTPTSTPAPVPKDTTPPPPQAPSIPRNTFTVDFGPTIIGVGVETAAKTFGKSKLKDVEISALGFAAQYEFQFFRWLSLPLKFAYMDFETKVTAKKTFEKNIDTTITINVPIIGPVDTLIQIKGGGSLEAKLEAELSIWSAEAHPRLYPFGGSFFLEGMLGYANLATKFSGEAIANVKMEVPEELAEFPEFSDIPGFLDTSCVVPVNFKASRGYLKYGGKLGWRVDFGKPGGFIFEHALGFYGASGLGNKTIVDQLATNIKEAAVNNPNPLIKVDKDKEIEVETQKFNDAFSLLEKFIFVGGPRYTFAFGWRF